MVTQTLSTGQNVRTEAGVPLQYAERGATTVAQYQTMAQQDLSDQQIAAQKAIADQQAAFNKQQFDYQQQLQAKQEQDAKDQADRQSTYDTGRAQNLSQGTQQINDAFAQFNDDYFNKYAQSYMDQVNDQIGYQKDQATKQTSFDMARAGLTNSQAHVNQLGLIDETAGRTIADQTQQAQDAANQLKTNLAASKNDLLNQLTASESIGSPIAGSSMGDVNSALQTQRSAITGIVSDANNQVSATQGVPTVSTIGNIFSGLTSAAGSGIGGVQANTQLAAAGMKPTSPFG